MVVIFGYCTKCDNKGFIIKGSGEPIPNSELTDYQFAMRMIEGGIYYRSYQVPCPALSNPKHKVPAKHRSDAL